MTQNLILDEKQNVKSFFSRLVKENYSVGRDSSFQLIYDSDDKIPYLRKVKNENYKLNCIINLLVGELQKLGRKVTYSKIKDDLLNKDRKKKAQVYQVLFYDERNKKLFDYFFILDTKLMKLFCYIRQTDFSKEKGRLLKVITFLHSQLYKDGEEIFQILKRNGFTITYEEVYHLLREIKS